MNFSVVERACAAAAAVLLLVAGAVVAVRSGSSGASSSSELSRSPAAVRPAPGWLTDPTGVDDTLSPADLDLPPGTNVYGVRLGKGDRAQSVVQAGAGGFGHDFWAAWSITVLAAVGALEFAGSSGFSGDATVACDTGVTATLR